MIKNWLSWINLTVGGLSGILLFSAIVIFCLRPSDIVVANPEAIKKSLPICSFAMSKEACDSIGTNAFDLKFSPVSLQLPNLQNHLIYYGKNGRPDALSDTPVLHFGFNGNPASASIISGQRLYLLYDRKKTPNQYTFSPENTETTLWIEPSVRGNEAVVKVSMRNENGEIVREPSSNAQFNLPEKEQSRPGGKAWEMGKWRVDGSLLARQKARWTGIDVFLERHGGPEFSHMQGKHRIDFTDEDETYSVYVGLNDSLIWDKERWKLVEPAQDTLKFPLIVVKKIDERIMNFELWDVGGKSKIVLNLIKAHEIWVPQNIQQMFQFLGARTRSQYIFEIDGNRMLLSPQDWLLQTEEGWIKLTTAQEIDDYVDRQLKGALFVFDGMVRQEDKQILKGVMFNAARTEMQEIEIPVQQGSKHIVSPKANDFDHDEDDDEDEEDEDSDEEEQDERQPTPATANTRSMETSRGVRLIESGK